MTKLQNSRHTTSNSVSILTLFRSCGRKASLRTPSIRFPQRICQSVKPIVYQQIKPCSICHKSVSHPSLGNNAHHCRTKAGNTLHKPTRKSRQTLEIRYLKFVHNVVYKYPQRCGYLSAIFCTFVHNIVYIF